MAIASAPSVDVDRFLDEGYLVVEDVLDVERDIEPVVREYEATLDREMARRHAEGKLSSTYADRSFDGRLAAFLSEGGRGAYQPLDISLPFSGVTEQTPIHLGPATFALLTSPRLIDAVEQIVGPEILSNPIQHVRIKPPERLLPQEYLYSLAGRTNWHQDQGVALAEIDETDMLTVWLPINDATVENGCLCVVPRSHRQGLVTHCPPRPGRVGGLGIPEEVRGPEFTPVPVRRGSVLFLHRQTIHGALSNNSDGVRWSYDLRYQPIGQATGRPWFPAFVVRSRRDPSSEVHDWRVWRDLWLKTRSHLAANPPEGKFNRWTGEEAVCSA